MIKSLRFTLIDYSKLVNCFDSIKNGKYWEIKNKNGKTIAKMDKEKFILIISNNKEIIKWLKENSFIS